MPEVDMDWVKQQLIQNKTKKMVGDAVLKMLETWGELKEKNSKNSKEILDLFQKLAQGYALVPENKNEKWAQALAGAIKVTDVVRVSFNAFDVESGKSQFNGRRGKVVGVRYGDIIFKSTDDKTPVIEGAHFRPEDLEKLV